MAARPSPTSPPAGVQPRAPGSRHAFGVGGGSVRVMRGSRAAAQAITYLRPTDGNPESSLWTKSTCSALTNPARRRCGLRLLSRDVNGRVGAGCRAQIDAVLTRQADVVALQEPKGTNHPLRRDALIAATYSIITTADLWSLPHAEVTAAVTRKDFNETRKASTRADDPARSLAAPGVIERFERQAPAPPRRRLTSRCGRAALRSGPDCELDGKMPQLFSVAKVGLPSKRDDERLLLAWLTCEHVRRKGGSAVLAEQLLVCGAVEREDRHAAEG